MEIVGQNIPISIRLSIAIIHTKIKWNYITSKKKNDINYYIDLIEEKRMTSSCRDGPLQKMKMQR
jgi:hypothetical protein